MKNIKLLLIFFIAPFFISAQEIEQSQVPAKVFDKMVSEYPSMRTFTWNRSRFNYEAAFTFKDKQTKVLLDQFGNILQTETTLSLNEILPAITNYVSTNYKTYIISNYSSVNSGGRILNFVKIKKESENSLRLIFDTDGNYVKTLYE